MVDIGVPDMIGRQEMMKYFSSANSDEMVEVDGEGPHGLRQRGWQRCTNGDFMTIREKDGRRGGGTDEIDAENFKFCKLDDDRLKQHWL